ncbi:hypothetical protein FCH28_05020 [Streptomyces piniterrae]|uniref:Secreted protein n=1 Tax=Streptomyces piniterrae TaxID=2571125 RepID=A0A4U0P2H1_9ACTN|nr:hypothetical protein [Streptomyces piniterrae]TJZ56874.1 hypothetical protein FCH28_05020 [Streptomyces piniterrae]
MRKIMAIALTVVTCGASLTLATASNAAAAERTPRCVKVQKYFDKDRQHYVKLTNLCTKRPACFTIAIPHYKDPHGRLAKGVTKDVRYAPASWPRAVYVKNTPC